MEPKMDRRKGQRFDSDLKIQYHLCVDLKTKICFWLKKSKRKKETVYEGYSKNVSVEGLCLVSNEQLEKDDSLMMDVYVPGSQTPVKMEGHVRWCRPLVSADKVTRFEAGVKLDSVNGESVEKSVKIDPVHKVLWSNVMEAVFSSFKNIAALNRKSQS